MVGLEACLDDWGPKAIVFLEQRRLDPFNAALQLPEDFVFAQIDRDAAILASYATGDCIKDLRTEGDAFRKIGFADLPVTPLMETVLREFYRDDELRIRRLTENWVGNPNAIYDGFTAWFDVRRVLASQLLRHRTLLPEQRELMTFMAARPGLRSLDYHQQWFAEGRTGDATGQYIKFQWAAAWNRAQSFSDITRRFSPDAWEDAYKTVLGTTHTPKLYHEMLAYLHEVAFLSFEAAPDVTRRLLGGVLYTTLLDDEKSYCLKRPVAAALEGDLRSSNPFFSDDFVLFDAARSAGYFRQDRGRWFVFKVTDQTEVDAHTAVTEALREPTATYTRLIERYQDALPSGEDLFSAGSKGLFAQQINAAKERMLTDPTLQRYFSRPCVTQAGLVLSPTPNIRVVTMHNAGKTLRVQVDEAETPDARTRLYENALETLARFHFMGTTNLLRLEGITTPIPHLVCRDGLSVPTISYPYLVARRIGGTVDAPRLGAHPKTDAILMEVHRIGQFLDRGCFGTIVQEPCEDNIAEGGIIDLEKLSLGNFLYDTARLLYGSSFERRKDLDICALREHYIRSLITPVQETHNAKNPLYTLDYDALRESYRHFKTNTVFMRVLTEALQMNYKRGIPQEVADSISDDVIAGFIGRSVVDATISWDCCKPDAEERMREYCQAAAILVCVGETGALVYQREVEATRTRDSGRLHALDIEIEHAVRNSLAFMHGQGFEQLGNDWEIYLRASGKIPSSFIVHEPRGFERALIPDLSARIDTELQHYGLGFRGDPKGPLSQAPSYGKKSG